VLMTTASGPLGAGGSMLTTGCGSNCGLSEEDKMTFFL